MEAFGRFLDVLDALREKCPWDRKQTNESLRANTIEETYELSDAIVRNDVHEICKELGDVLLHICFYAKIGEEKEQFDIAEVCNKAADKLIFRHPHVYHPSQVGAPHPKPLPYGEKEEGREFADASTVTQVLENWEQIKLKEKDGNKTVLSGVPASLPSLIKAYRIQDKARNVGFDWEDKSGAWEKVHEELGELEEALNKGDKEASLDELGDFLFSIINVSRFYKLNPGNTGNTGISGQATENTGSSPAFGAYSEGSGTSGYSYENTFRDSFDQSRDDFGSGSAYSYNSYSGGPGSAYGANPGTGAASGSYAGGSGSAYGGNQGTGAASGSYVPSESNLKARREFSSRRLGIFLHWGIYAMYGQGEWYLNNGRLLETEYRKAAKGFYPIEFNADEWIKAFKDAGAGYITFTSRDNTFFVKKV